MKDKELQKKLEELATIAKDMELDIYDDVNRITEKVKGVKSESDVWDKVELARHNDRPNTLDYISGMASEYMEFHGDRYYGDDNAIVGGIAIIDGITFSFIGHQKGKNMKENIFRNYGMAHPEGYRKALRIAQQAEKFGRPLLTFIDTPGAFPGLASEERGMGEAIARNLKYFSTLRIPTMSFIIGEGGSGGAIGIGVTDRVFMLENSIYSVISPEGLASILLRDAKKAKFAANNLMKITAQDLKMLGIIDGIVHEPAGGAHVDIDFMIKKIKETISITYKELSSKRFDQLLLERSQRIFSYGQVSSEMALTNQKSWIQRFLMPWKN